MGKWKRNDIEPSLIYNTFARVTSSKPYRLTLFVFKTLKNIHMEHWQLLTIS